MGLPQSGMVDFHFAKDSEFGLFSIDFFTKSFPLLCQVVDLRSPRLLQLVMIDITALRGRERLFGPLYFLCCTFIRLIGRAIQIR